jgi:DNA-directed RNA polymerase specialized sigma24 family protein
MPPTREQQFETMTLPLVRGLFQTAWHLIADRSLAEETVQDVYASAWKAFRRGSDGVEWRVELFRLLISSIRRRNRGWFEVAHSTPSTDAPPLGHLTAGLARLPGHLREIILLVDCQGFTYKESEEILGLSAEKLAAALILARDTLSREVFAAGQPTPSTGSPFNLAAVRSQGSIPSE